MYYYARGPGPQTELTETQLGGKKSLWLWIAKWQSNHVSCNFLIGLCVFNADSF